MLQHLRPKHFLLIFILLSFVNVVCFMLGVNCLAAAGAEQSSGSGDNVPPPRPPPPKTQQPAAQGWFLLVSELLPCYISLYCRYLCAVSVKFADCVKVTIRSLCTIHCCLHLVILHNWIRCIILIFVSLLMHFHIACVVLFLVVSRFVLIFVL